MTMMVPLGPSYTTSSWHGHVITASAFGPSASVLTLTLLASRPTGNTLTTPPDVIDTHSRLPCESYADICVVLADSALLYSMTPGTRLRFGPDGAKPSVTTAGMSDPDGAPETGARDSGEAQALAVANSRQTDAAIMFLAMMQFP